MWSKICVALRKKNDLRKCFGKSEKKGRKKRRIEKKTKISFVGGYFVPRDTNLDVPAHFLLEFYSQPDLRDRQVPRGAWEILIYVYRANRPANAFGWRGAAARPWEGGRAASRPSKNKYVFAD